MKEIEIYTDGSCLGNPGPGGYGAVLKYRSYVRELSNGYLNTTNNRMELMAVIAALQILVERCHIHLTTDSQYVKQGIESWIRGWKRNGWVTKTGAAVKNADLWRQLDALVSDHQISWHWVKGHSGHKENERCDELARSAASRSKGALQKDDSRP